ncbi:lipase 1-like [Nilaparvata lugens]|uniref:lipase 1-like n=1 Tax=Nilaparvata lugens TaxID=108931 RepID=UPI00193E329A|nr:lipase 1-like [Nilaparvata lugens]
MVCYSQQPYLTTDERIKIAGFQSETHRVTTRDGYILTLFRIVTSAENNTGSPRRRFPILLQHGFLMSSDCFLVKDDATGFVLARDNWDVWLGNFRGNSYSRMHKWLSPNEPQFWNYSFDDIGRKDLPAMIDYILKYTRNPRLNYIGHSMGTSTFFVLTSTIPSYNRKINSMVGISAVVRMAGWSFAIKKDESLIYNYLRKFHRFDYGRERNLKVWGSETPPLYNLSKVRAPVIIYYSSGDVILEQDEEIFAKGLPNLVHLAKIPSVAFNHMDFCFTTFDLNSEYRRRMLASITEELSKRDGDLSWTDKVVKNICDHDKDCIKVL